MMIQQVRVYSLSLPFSVDFSHAMSKRSSARNVVVEVVADGGRIKGYGEGAPRSYVTGESQRSAVASLNRFLSEDGFPWDLGDVSQVWDLVDGLPPGKGNHAAICALETALLDALGRERSRPVTAFFPGDFSSDTVTYGTPVPMAGRDRVLDICRLSKKMDIKRLKFKVGKDLEKNRAALEVIPLVFGRDYDLKIDVNMVWDYGLAVSHLPLLTACGVRVVEQPMPPGDPDTGALAARFGERNIMLMADESACTLKDAERILREGHFRMLNMRLSKCGGFRRTLGMIDFARANGLSFQIACHLGESGILSAAGRALSLLCRDAVYHDGSYDAYLLEENVTTEDVSFERGGKAGPLKGPGLGIRVDRERLIRLSEGGPTLTISRP